MQHTPHTHMTYDRFNFNFSVHMQDHDFLLFLREFSENSVSGQQEVVGFCTLSYVLLCSPMFSCVLLCSPMSSYVSLLLCSLFYLLSISFLCSFCCFLSSMFSLPFLSSFIHSLLSSLYEEVLHFLFLLSFSSLLLLVRSLLLHSLSCLPKPIRTVKN